MTGIFTYCKRALLRLGISVDSALHCTRIVQLPVTHGRIYTLCITDHILITFRREDGPFITKYSIQFSPETPLSCTGLPRNSSVSQTLRNYSPCTSASEVRRIYPIPARPTKIQENHQTNPPSVINVELPKTASPPPSLPSWRRIIRPHSLPLVLITKTRSRVR